MPVDFVKNKQITFKRSISVKDDDVTQLQKPINLVADLTWNSPSAGDFAEKLKLDPINIFTGRKKDTTIIFINRYYFKWINRYI